MLRHPVLKRDFLARFAQRTLMQYEMRGLHRLGKGPLVVCIDSSGSMTGTKEEWSKSVALCLMAIAREEKRAFAIVLFSSKHEIRTERFEGSPNLELLIGVMEHHYGGGTAFGPPLDAALELIEESEFQKADVIFITDGLSHLDGDYIRDFNRRRRIKQARVYSILMDSGYADADTIKKFSDGFERLSDMEQDGEALDLAFGI